ncbi:MAG: permease [Candidatus Hodarchaeales archaeon]|jgi:uncharacterized membrane protein YraQ (UPF0718 family)
MELKLELLLIIFVIVGLYLLSLKKDLGKTKIAIRKSLNIMLMTTPFLIAALVLMGLFSVLIEPQMVKDLLGEEQGLSAYVIATLIGFPLPGPRYAIYPLIQELINDGASIGVAATIISGQQIIDVPEGFLLEIKLLGWRFFIIRTISAVIIVFLLGLIIGTIFLYIPL